MIVSYNKLLACLVPEQIQEEVKVVGGVRSPVHKTSLTKIAVKYGNADIPSGSIIYVPTILTRNQKWSSEIYDFDGDRLWMVPEQVVVLVDRKLEEVLNVPVALFTEVEKSVYRTGIHLNSNK